LYLARECLMGKYNQNQKKILLNSLNILGRSHKISFLPQISSSLTEIRFAVQFLIDSIFYLFSFQVFKYPAILVTDIRYTLFLFNLAVFTLLPENFVLTFMARKSNEACCESHGYEKITLHVHFLFLATQLEQWLLGIFKFELCVIT